MSVKLLRYVNTFALALTVCVNALANIIPIGIGTTGDVSKKYGNLFTPAPYTFIIWGFIYLCLLAFVLYGWGLFDGDGKNGRSREVVDSIGLWFTLGCIFNIGWIFTWHFDAIGLSTIMIAALLVTLIFANRALGRIKLGIVDMLCAGLGFGVYYGWIIAATIANVSVWLVKLFPNTAESTQVIITCAVLALGAFIGTLAAVKDGKYLPTVAVIWAYCGIIIRHVSPDGYGGKYLSIILTAIVSIAVMAVGIFAAYIINRDRKKKLGYISR